MKLSYYPGILSSIGVIDGFLYHSFEPGGIYCTSSQQIDLNLYLEGIEEIYIKQDKLKVSGLVGDVNEKIMKYPDLSDINLPLRVQGDVKRINYFDNRYISYVKRVKHKREMIVFDLESKATVAIHDVGGWVHISQACIIFRKVGKVLSYNWSGHKMWEYAVGKSYDGTDERISERKDRVIFNAGNSDDNQGCLVLLDKTSGSLQWEKKFDQPIGNALVIEAEIYLAQKNKMMVLSADTAETLLAFEAALPEDELQTTLWTDGKLLYVLASQSNQLQCYTRGGELIKSYQLPERPDMRHGCVPYAFDNVNYLGLTPGFGQLAGVEGGLLTWTADDVLAGKELEFEEKPNIITMTVGEGDGSQSYYANIPCGNIHDVLRFGEIEVRRIAALRGRHFTGITETLNKKFNGQIKLIIDPIVGEENRPYLNMLAKRGTSFAKVMDITSGDGKKPVVVTWAFANEL